MDEDKNLLSENDIRRIAETAKRELGDQATPELLKLIVKEVVQSLSKKNESNPDRKKQVI